MIQEKIRTVQSRSKREISLPFGSIKTFGWFICFFTVEVCLLDQEGQMQGVFMLRSVSKPATPSHRHTQEEENDRFRRKEKKIRHLVEVLPTHPSTHRTKQVSFVLESCP